MAASHSTPKENKIHGAISHRKSKLYSSTGMQNDTRASIIDMASMLDTTATSKPLANFSEYLLYCLSQVDQSI